MVGRCGQKACYLMVGAVLGWTLSSLQQLQLNGSSRRPLPAFVNSPNSPALSTPMETFAGNDEPSLLIQPKQVTPVQEKTERADRNAKYAGLSESAGRNARYPGLKTSSDQMRSSEVQSQQYKFWKDHNGFCRLEGFELNGPLYPKGPALPGGLRYEDFLNFNGPDAQMGRWHKLKFHVLVNEQVVFLITPKSGSTSTRQFLERVGKQSGNAFQLRFDLVRWWKLVQAGQETKPFLDWFFSPEIHGNRHFITTIREPYSRLDSGTGTVLNRAPKFKNKTHLAEAYGVGTFHEALEHIYPQSYFYSHARNLTIFRTGKEYGERLKRLLQGLMPGGKIDGKMSGSANKREGKGVDRNLTQHLIDSGNHVFLRDYVFDEILWQRANELQC